MRACTRLLHPLCLFGAGGLASDAVKKLKKEFDKCFLRLDYAFTGGKQLLLAFFVPAPCLNCWKEVRNVSAYWLYMHQDRMILRAMMEADDGEKVIFSRDPKTGQTSA